MLDSHQSSVLGKKERWFQRVPVVLACIFSGYIALTVVLNVFVAPFISFRNKWVLDSYGWFFLLLGCLLGLVFCFLVSKLSPLVQTWFTRLPASWAKTHALGLSIALGCIVLFILQIYIVIGCYYTGLDWDAPFMLWMPEQAWIDLYYSTYPNNLFLGGIFSLIKQAFGGEYNETVQFVATVLGCISANAAVAMIAFIVNKLAHTTAAICAFVLAFYYIGLNPHLLVPYSDAYSLAFVAGIACLYICCQNPLLKWPLMGVVAVLGYSLKPTVVLAVVAIAVVEVCRALSNWDSANVRSKMRRYILGIASTICACAIAFATVALVGAAVHAQINPKEAFSFTHYFMLGANKETNGSYSKEDYDYSSSFTTQENRAAANLQQGFIRYANFGVVGTIKHVITKNLIIYSTGDFLWYRPTRMFMTKIFGDNTALQQFYGIYASKELDNDKAWEDATPSPWSYSASALWYVVLVGIVALGFKRLRGVRSTADKGICMLCMSLLFLSVFLLIFEASGRYLFLYSPYFVILGILGWDFIGQQLNAAMRQRSLARRGR